MPGKENLHATCAAAHDQYSMQQYNDEQHVNARSAAARSDIQGEQHQGCSYGIEAKTQQPQGLAAITALLAPAAGLQTQHGQYEIISQRQPDLSRGWRDAHVLVGCQSCQRLISMLQETTLQRCCILNGHVGAADRRSFSNKANSSATLPL